MLYTDFTEKLLGLQDLKVTKVEKNEKAVCESCIIKTDCSESENDDIIILGE